VKRSSTKPWDRTVHGGSSPRSGTNCRPSWWTDSEDRVRAEIGRPGPRFSPGGLLTRPSRTDHDKQIEEPVGGRLMDTDRECLSVRSKAALDDPLHVQNPAEAGGRRSNSGRYLLAGKGVARRSVVPRCPSGAMALHLTFDTRPGGTPATSNPARCSHWWTVTIALRDGPADGTMPAALRHLSMGRGANLLHSYGRGQATSNCDSPLFLVNLSVSAPARLNLFSHSSPRGGRISDAETRTRERPDPTGCTGYSPV